MVSTKLDERTKCASAAQAITLSDTAEVTFADIEEGTTKYCRGFHASQTGTLACILAQDEISVSLRVIEGSYYPFSVKKFLSTGSSGLSAGNIVAMR
jgi:hypothetical protein